MIINEQTNAQIKLAYGLSKKLAATIGMVNKSGPRPTDNWCVESVVMIMVIMSKSRSVPAKYADT